MNVELINPAVTPMLACGPSFGPGFVAAILAVLGFWVLAGLAGFASLLLSASRSGKAMAVNLGIVGIAALLGSLAFEHVGGNSMLVAGAIGAPVLLFGQFAYFLKKRRRRASME